MAQEISDNFYAYTGSPSHWAVRQNKVVQTAHCKCDDCDCLAEPLLEEEES